MGFFSNPVKSIQGTLSNPGKTLQNGLNDINKVVNDLGKTAQQILKDPKALAVLAINVYAPGAGAAIGQAMGLTGTMASFVGTTALNTAVNGGDVKAAATAAALSIGGKAVANQVTKALTDKAIPTALAAHVGQATGTAMMAKLTGQDPIKAIKDYGISAGVNILANQIDGFSKLPTATQNGIKTAITGKLQGKKTSQINQALIAGAITDGLTYLKKNPPLSTAPTTAPAPKPAVTPAPAPVVSTAPAPTPEDKINELVQQTQGREATPEEVASLLGNMIQKEQVTPTPTSLGVQLASSDPAFKVDMTGFAYTKDSAPPNLQPPSGMRLLTDAEVNADPDAKAVNFVDANGKTQSAFLVPADVGITKPLEVAQPIETPKVTPVDLSAPQVVSDYIPVSADVPATTSASGQGTVTSPLKSLESTKQDVLAAITGQTGQGVSTTSQPTTVEPIPVSAEKITAPLSSGTQTVASPLTTGTTSSGTSAGTVSGADSGTTASTAPAPSTVGGYGNPITTTVDYGLGPATVNVPSPPDNMDVLDEVTATATQEKEPITVPVTTLSPLPQTTVEPRPVANVVVDPVKTPTAPVTLPVSQPSYGSTGQQTTLASSTDTTGANPTSLPPSFLTTTMTADKFESPLEAFRKLQSEQPIAPSANNQIMQQQQAKPMNDYYSYGQVPSMDDIFGFSSTAIPMMAEGGLTGTRYGKYATGGMATPLMAAGGKLRVDFRHGDAVTGAGDGQSDDIPAMLADGEFVFPADVVAAIGNGSTKAGSDKLYDMMHGIRAHVRSAKPEDLPPEIKSPLHFLKTKPSAARR